MHCRRNSPAGALAPHASPKLNCLRAVGSAVPLQASRITMPDNAAFTVVVYDNAFGNILAVPGRSVEAAFLRACAICLCFQSWYRGHVQREWPPWGLVS